MNDSLISFASRLRQTLSEGAEMDFNSLALELFRVQFELNPIYRQYCRAIGVGPEDILEWQRIPALPVAAFKEFAVSCLAPGECIAEFHSSGTTHRKQSRHLHGRESLALYETAVLGAFQTQVLPGAGLAPGEFDPAILTPPPSEAPHSSLVHMFATWNSHLGHKVESFLGRAAADGWTIDFVRARRKLTTATKPIAIWGTAFSFVQLLDHFAGLALHLPKGSFALETGGYKGRSRTLPRQELHTLITDRLGIASDRILGEYGMSELGSQAYARSGTGMFYFPRWARALVISPESGKEVANGETGLIRVIDLANAFSVLAIETEDVGRRQDSGFELIGRAENVEPRGCSLMTVDA